MGTEWDIRCIDCGETEKLDHNDGKIYTDTIRAIARLITTDLGDVDVRIDGVRAPMRWLAKHAGHRLRPVSEYGEIDGTCSKRTSCEHCRAPTGYCDKDLDHQGPHGKRGAEGRTPDGG